MALKKFRFCSIGSGSRGNGLIIECGNTRVLVDCGFSFRESVRRLAVKGVSPQSLDGIVVTHEHGDHVGGVEKLATKYNLKIFLTPGTSYAIGDNSEKFLIRDFSNFAIGDLWVNPFPVPHDANEPSQFLFSDGNRRLGLLTDLGHSTSYLEGIISGCHGLILECNHDLGMLANSQYPKSLKDRISGRLGHLDNRSAAGILATIDCTQLRHIVAAHLSEANNTADLARSSLSAVLNTSPDWVGVATQSDGFDWRDL